VVACTASAAHGLIYMATERVSAANIAPVTYVQLLTAVGLGMLWFGEQPDWVTAAGALLVVSAGLVLWRDQASGSRR
jgi:drug/metabolite transporter (DMT)-like permease